MRIVSANGEFDEVYELPAEGWRYIGKPGANRGYLYRSRSGAIQKLRLRPRRQLKLKGKSSDMGYTLASDPGSVYWVIQLGSRTFGGEFGGKTRFTANKSFKAKSAPVPNSMADL